ncbi:hypothetical protein [Alishewanella phage vB_AspM_Slickus01]|nr:hypothetical protein [Alishewanella phage vB_AspM_Slickus01]
MTDDEILTTINTMNSDHRRVLKIIAEDSMVIRIEENGDISIWRDKLMLFCSNVEPSTITRHVLSFMSMILNSTKLKNVFLEPFESEYYPDNEDPKRIVVTKKTQLSEKIKTILSILHL